MSNKRRGFFCCLGSKGSKHRVVNIYDRDELKAKFRKKRDWRMTDENLIELAKKFHSHCNDEMTKPMFK